MKMRPEQNRRLHFLLNELGLMDYKAELVEQYSATKATSAKELTPQEAKALIEHLERSKGRQANRPQIQRTPAEKMRRKIFAICYTIGWIEGESPADRAMNRAKIDSFCARNSYLRKPLNDYTLDELPKLVSQFEQIQRHVEKSKLSKEAGQAVRAVLAELGLNR
ncbi:phage protein GemA/Gp16 family protein [Rufibacter sp. LB8]|uniref:phage protein GemA/Gp16 family protein n=2 Tax=Rufibacter sp. LB8 TaxID=2777781 RepID=UPI00178C4829|nr:phage protein GemA/Gp16 family protein [Rufibacter sp. LB8]